MRTKRKAAKPDPTVNGTRIDITHGTEGPHYDPYSYTEVTVWRLGHVWTLHSGLGVWMQKDGTHIEGAEKDLYELFEKETGANPHQWEHWYYDRRHRCPQCGTRNLTSESGYPGETITCCPKCKIIVYSDVNWSAIE